MVVKMKHAIPPIVCFLLLALVAIALVLCMGGCSPNNDATYPSGQMVVESVDVLTPSLTAHIVRNKTTNQTFLVVVERPPGHVTASGVSICELEEPK